MAIRRVTGIALSGANVTLTFGKLQVRSLGASYGDKLEVAELTEMGSQEITEVTDGTYSVDEGEVKVSAVEFRTVIMPNMPKNGGGLVRIPIIVGFRHPDLGSDSDLLDGCRILNWAQALENSNSAFEVPLKIKPRQIYWTEARKTINQLRGVPDGRGGSGF